MASSSAKEKNEPPCAVCGCNESKYTCPRCEILYCSLTCYKSQKHGQCSETFYEECVQEELGGMQGDPEARKRMEEILRKTREMEESESEEEVDDSDDELDEDLAKRLEDVDLNDVDAVWSKLTKEEMKDYAQMIASGRILDCVPESEPWWITGNYLPPLASDIPSISSLTSKPPSASLPFHVMNTIMSYQLTMRIFKEQKEYLCVEAATAILALSPTLRGVSVSCNSQREAENLLLEEASKCTWLEKKPERAQLSEDLESLTAAVSIYLLQALSDIKAIFDDAVVQLEAKKDVKRFTGKPPKVSDLKKATKKAMFYLSWAKDYDDEHWSSLVGNVPLITECE